jgi:ATP-dependent helicase/DNAse subunit B
MPLTLVLGPANSAKAGEMFGAYAAAAPRGALLVVPTYDDVRHYSRELAEQGTVLSSVLTFSGLARDIARRTGYGGRAASPLARERLLLAALREQRFDVLAESARSPGFLAAAAALIAELERSLISPERFARALHRWGADHPHRARYAREVAGIYEAYAGQLERVERVDRELYAWRALDALRAAPGRWGSDQVFFYGFDDLHPLERDGVETLALVAGADVTLSLTYEAGRPALAARAEVVEELRPLAQRVVELPALDEHYEPGSRLALHHLERWLFSVAPESGSEPERVDPGPAVRLLEAGGERAEAELVGAEILSLLRSGVPAEGIAVVCRSVARSAEVFESVFSQYGIPVALDHEVEFGQTPLGRTVLAMLRCALLPEQATARDLLQYLRWPGVLDRVELADVLEAQVRRERLGRLEDAWTRLGFEFEEIIAMRRAADPTGELIRQARRLLALPHGACAPVLQAAEQLDARALSTMLSALTELSELGLTPSGAELVGLLERLPVEAGRSIRPGAVQVSEPLAVRARRFQVVFVCGLQESEFPQPAMAEPFLSDESRRELFTASGLRLRPMDDTLVRERYLFYSAVSRATDQVVLSWRSSDEEGNLGLRSPFIDDVAQLLVPEWDKARRRRLLGDVVWPVDEAPTERERRHALAASGAPAQGSGEEDAALRTLSETARRHVRHQQIVSGGALEAFADCPVKWLVDRELSPPPLDPDPDPLARGAFIHRALETVIDRLEGPVSASSLPEAERILGDVLTELAPDLSPGRSPAVRAATVASIEADLRRYLRYEARQSPHWEPQGLELRFGFDDDEGSLPALVLGGDSELVRVRGVMDRVDVDPSGTGQAIVRDYKSGNTRQEYQGARWRTDRRLQVALYMLAVRQLMNLDPVAGLYQPLGGNEIRARGLFLSGGAIGAALVGTDARERSELDAELEDAAARAVEVARTLRQGSLAPCPETCSRYGCSFPGICRTEL